MSKSATFEGNRLMDRLTKSKWYDTLPVRLSKVDMLIAAGPDDKGMLINGEPGAYLCGRASRRKRIVLQELGKSAAFSRRVNGSQITPKVSGKSSRNLAVNGDVGCHISNESGWPVADRPPNSPGAAVGS